MNNLSRIFLATITLALCACSDVAIYKNCTFAVGDKLFEIKVAPNSLTLSGNDLPLTSFTDGQKLDGKEINVRVRNDVFRRVVAIDLNQDDGEKAFFEINHFTKEFSMFVKKKGAEDIEKEATLYGKCGVKELPREKP